MNRLVLFLLLFGVFAHDAFGKTSGRKRNVRPSVRVERPVMKPLFNGGLQSSLSASGYRFTLNPPLPHVRSSLRMARPGFSATLPAGDYAVEVSPAYVIQIYPPPPMPSGRARVAVTAGETTETAIVLSVPKLVVDPAPN